MNSGSCPPWQAWPEAVGLFLRGVTVRTAAPVALCVGTVLSSVNEGALIAAGKIHLSVFVRVAVNYLTPFTVTSIGYLMGGRARGRGED